MKTGNQLGSDWLELSNLELDSNVTTGQVQLAGVGTDASGGPRPPVSQVLLGRPHQQHHHNCRYLQRPVRGRAVMAGCVLQSVLPSSLARLAKHKQQPINSENTSISSLLSYLRHNTLFGLSIRKQREKNTIFYSKNLYFLVIMNN